MWGVMSGRKVIPGVHVPAPGFDSVLVGGFFGGGAVSGGNGLYYRLMQRRRLVRCLVKALALQHQETAQPDADRRPQLLQETVAGQRNQGVVEVSVQGDRAAVVAGVLTGQTGRCVRVRLPGGELELEWNAPGGEVFLTGPAVEVFTGEWPIDPSD